VCSRLQELGLTHNQGRGHAKGERNIWTLTVVEAQWAQLRLLQCLLVAAAERRTVEVLAALAREEEVLAAGVRQAPLVGLQGGEDLLGHRDWAGDGHVAVPSSADIAS